MKKSMKTQTQTRVTTGAHVLVSVALLTAGVAVAAAAAGFVTVEKAVQKKGTVSETEKVVIQSFASCGSVVYPADYIVTPTPSGPYEYARPSFALTAAQAEGDLDGDGVIKICLRSGTTSAPNVYLDYATVTVDLVSWNVTHGTGDEPLVIFSDGTSESVRWRQPGGQVLLIAKNTDPTSQRTLTISNIGFMGPGRAMDFASWNAPQAEVFLNADRFVDFDQHAVIAGSVVPLSIQHSQFSGNTNAILAYHQAKLQFSFNEFFRNKGGIGLGGAAVWALGFATITDQRSVYRANRNEIAGAMLLDENSSYDGTNVSFHANQATNNNITTGGGAVVASQHAVMECLSCIWNENDGGPQGGAVTIGQFSQGIFDDNIFQGNHARSAGAIADTSSEDIVITNSVFEENQATRGSGGAMRSHSNAGEVTITGTQFVGNTSKQIGGALYFQGAQVVMDGVSAFNNSAYGQGGFLAMAEGSFDGSHLNVRLNSSVKSPIAGMGFLNTTIFNFSNSIIAGNTSPTSISGFAAGVDLNPGTGNPPYVSLDYVTIAGNANTFAGGQLIGNGWMDHIVSAYNEGLQLSGTTFVTLDHSDLYSVPPGVGENGNWDSYQNGDANVNTDPQFVGDGTTTDPSQSLDILNFDFHLQPSSPAKDIDASELDVDGTPADAGAYGGPGGGW